MKHLVVAEKPSVGRDIARVLQCKEQKTGYLSDDEYIVTWGIGHLVTNCLPGEINPSWQMWKLEDLPILPDPIPLKVIQETKKQKQ
jgi:DNA topoisomerase-3